MRAESKKMFSHIYLGVPASPWPAAEASRVSWVCRTEQDRAGEEGQVPLTAAQAPSQPGRDGTTTGLCHLCQAATERGCCLRSTAEERAYGRPQCPLEVEKYLIIWWQRRTGGCSEAGLLHQARRDCSRLPRDKGGGPLLGTGTGGTRRNGVTPPGSATGDSTPSTMEMVKLHLLRSKPQK